MENLRALVISGVFIKFHDIRVAFDYPGLISYSGPLTNLSEEELLAIFLYPIHEDNAEYNSATHSRSEPIFVAVVENVANFTYELTALPAPAAPSLEMKYRMLWNAANRYQTDQISGAALPPAYDGFKQSLPKCSAVVIWINSVWAEYYARKAGVSEEAMPDLDFSSCGAMPHSVPELMVELGFSV